MTQNILTIEDDIEITELLKEYLGNFGYSVTAAFDGEMGLQALKAKKFDLVILDVMLPGKTGIEICMEIRKSSSIPIIMLTARGETTDKVLGLEIGADDYLAKPFEPRELVARIKSLLRRSESKSTNPDSNTLKFENLIIDKQKMRVKCRGRHVDFTTAEFSVLCTLCENQGRVFSREKIQETLHGMDWASLDRGVDVLVSKIRQKLGDNPKSPEFIKTIWGSGYAFIAPEIKS